MRSLSCIFYFICIISFCTGYAQVPVFVPEEWSGTATMVYTVKEGSHFFTELRYEATISKGKGKATTTYRMRIQQKESTETGSSQGTGPTSLHIDFDPPYYSFMIPTPASVGKATRTIKNGGTETYTIGEEESLIKVDNQKLGENVNMLSGNFTEGDASGMLTITWNLYSGTVDGELIVDALNYPTWQPEPGADETITGSRLTLQLNLVDKKGEPSRLNAKYFELELKNTSKEPGLAINYPVNLSSAPMYDIRFIEIPGAVISNQGQSMRLNASESGDDTAVIGSFDGGGYTTLTVFAILQDERKIEGHLEKPGGITEIDIPKRRAGSKIAISWLVQTGALTDDDDNEKSKGNLNNGDGLSAYEEYRGVWSQGKWKRLNPRKKELAVRVDELEVFEEGLQVLTDASEVVVIPLKADELSQDRKLNKNVSVKKHDQYAMWLVNGPTEDSVAGENQPIGRTKKTPKESEKVIINVNLLTHKFNGLKKYLDEINYPIPFTLQHWIKTTTAHELAHGIGVDHHGAEIVTLYPQRIVIQEGSPDRAFGYDGGEIIERPQPINGEIGRPGGLSSGDLSCMMAYPQYYQWARRQKAGAIYYYSVPILADGIILCTSAKGTGINAARRTGANKEERYFGDATLGNCLGKIKVKDD